MTLESIEKKLRDAGIDEAKTESYLLTEHFLHIPKSRLILMRDEELCASEDELRKLEDAVSRRIRREPFTYITGVAYFMDEEYEVSPDCLVPRPETELLVLEGAKQCPKGGRILDVCTGSGCIAISLLSMRKDVTATAIDISIGAVSLAKRNAERNGVENRIEIYEADMFTYGAVGEYDVILSNPPYIAENEMDSLMPELSFEPRIALTDGGDGLSFYRELIGRYMGYVKLGGALLCEIGYEEGDAVLKIAEENGYDGEILKDYSGNPRILRIQKQGKKTF